MTENNIKLAIIWGCSALAIMFACGISSSAYPVWGLILPTIASIVMEL